MRAGLSGGVLCGRMLKPTFPYRALGRCPENRLLALREDERTNGLLMGSAWVTGPVSPKTWVPIEELMVDIQGCPSSRLEEEVAKS